MDIKKSNFIKKANPLLGFNLKEMMVVLLILGIISVFAISKYNDYYKKARLISALNYADIIKEKIMFLYANTSQFPDDDYITNFNSALDENTKKSISSMLYRRGSTGLPQYITDKFGSSIVANFQTEYILNPADPTKTTRLYYVGIATSNSVGQGTANATSDEQITWQAFGGAELASANVPTLQIINVVGPAACGGNDYWAYDNSGCVPCLAGATCSNGIMTCPDGYYGSTCSDLINNCNGFVTNDTPSSPSVCKACPANHICSNRGIIGCDSNYYGNSCSLLCDNGVLQGRYLNRSCAACPAHSVCSKGAIIDCQPDYYGKGCSLLCSGVLSGQWPNKICTEIKSQCPSNAVCSPDGSTVIGCQPSYYYYQGTCVAGCPNNTYPINSSNLDCNVGNNPENYSNSGWIYHWKSTCQMYSSVLNGGTPTTICNPCHTWEHTYQPSWYFCGCIVKQWQGMPNCYVTWIVSQGADCSSFCRSVGGFAMVGPFC